ncbi:MAG: hypothetical protein AB7O72_15810 [Ramlibacter sp.]
MKRTAIALAVAALLSGCAGLNVSWHLTASYQTNVSTVTQAAHLTNPANKEIGK